jgi:hypothetical protein
MVLLPAGRYTLSRCALSFGIQMADFWFMILRGRFPCLML